MFNVKLPDLKKILNFNNKKDIEMLNRAYVLNQNFYPSLEERIFNDLYNQVAIHLSRDFGADADTIISSMIYKYVKKNNLSDKEVATLFNKEVAKKVMMLNEFDYNLLNCSYDDKLVMIKSISKDVKVTIIKLVERLCIIQLMGKNHIIDDADFIDDTLKFYVPVSKILGIYKLKNLLEDYCFKYDSNYDSIKEIKDNVSREYSKVINTIMSKIKSLNFNICSGLEFEINKRSNYEIYSKSCDYKKRVKQLSDKEIELSGFCSVKCLVDNKKDCYELLYLIHQFNYLMNTFNDYLSGNYENEYKAIHTNVFIGTCLVDFRICTKEMDKVNLYGIITDWQKGKDLQQRLVNNYDFYDKLIELEATVPDNQLVEQFMMQIINAQMFSIESIKERRARSLNLMKKGKNK